MALRNERRYLRSAKARAAFDWFSEVTEGSPEVRKLVIATFAIVGHECPDLNIWEQVAETRKRLRSVFEQTHPDNQPA